MQVSYVDGFEHQVDVLSDSVKNFLSKNIKADQLDSLALSGVVQQEVDALGLNLKVGCTKKISDSEAEYSLSCFNNLTNASICNVDVSRSGNGSYKIRTSMNPNNDGCIKDSDDGKLIVCEPVEAVFVKSGKTISEGTDLDFCTGDENVYKIIQKPSLWQMVNGPCGYYALYNALSMYNGQDSCKNLLDRVKFEENFAIWKAHIGNEALSNYDVKDLVEKKVSELCKSNVIITVSDINSQNRMLESETFCFGGSTIDERIKDFQENGTEQYIILGTGTASKIKGIRFNWENFNGRHACVENHWVAIKIEWKDKSKPGKCPVIMTVADSSGTKDDRYAAPLHWYYQVFVNGSV